MSLRIHVEAQSDYSATERPCRFTLDEESCDIDVVEDQWYEPGALYFRVRTPGPRRFILRYDEKTGKWTLRSGFDAAELQARPGIRLITVDEILIRAALLHVEYCEACRPEESEIPLDWLLQEVSGAGEMTDFVMVATARCHTCGQPVTEKTLVARTDG